MYGSEGNNFISALSVDGALRMLSWEFVYFIVEWHYFHNGPSLKWRKIILK